MKACHLFLQIAKLVNHTSNIDVDQDLNLKPIKKSSNLDVYTINGKNYLDVCLVIFNKINF